MIGLMSYSIYLWHWPLIVLARYTVGLTAVSISSIILSTLLLSYLSFRFVEQPIRKSKIGRSKSLVSAGAAIASFWLMFYPRGIQSTGSAIHSPTGFSTYMLPTEKFWNLEHCGGGRINSSHKLGTINFQECWVRKERFKQENRIFVMGDSYGQQIVPAFEHIEGYSVLVFASSGCPFWDVEYKQEAPRGICHSFSQKFIDFFLPRLKVGDIVIAASSFHYFQRDHELIRDGSEMTQSEAISDFVSQIATIGSRIEERGAKFIVVGDIPILTVDPNTCRSNLSEKRSECFNIQFDQSEAYRRLVTKALKAGERVHPYQVVDIFEPVSELLKVEKSSIYYNRGHLSRKGAKIVLNQKLIHLL